MILAVFVSLFFSAIADVIHADTLSVYRDIIGQQTTSVVVVGVCTKAISSCRRFAFLLSEIDERHGGHGVRVVHITNAALALELHVETSPSVIVFKSDGAERRYTDVAAMMSSIEEDMAPVPLLRVVGDDGDGGLWQNILTGRT